MSSGLMPMTLLNEPLARCEMACLLANAQFMPQFTALKYFCPSGLVMGAATSSLSLMGMLYLRLASSSVLR